MKFDIDLKVRDIISKNKNNNIYDSCYVFGDSLSDSGALKSIFNYINSFFKNSRFLSLPTILNSKLAYKNVSFSNGEVALSIVIRFINPLNNHFNEYNVLKPALIYSGLNNVLRIKGYNYATGGAFASVKNLVNNENVIHLFRNAIIKNQSLVNQIDSFKIQYSKNSILEENNMAFLNIGTNDLINFFFTLSNYSLRKEMFYEDKLNLCIKFILEEIKNGIINLANLGINKIFIFTFIDLSLIPRFLESSRMLKHQKFIRNTIKRINQQLLAMVVEFQKLNIDIFCFDTFKHFNKILKIYVNKNYNVTESSIQKRYLSKINILDPILEYKKNHNKYLFWDKIHPSKTLHYEIASCFIKELKEKKII